MEKKAELCCNCVHWESKDEPYMAPVGQCQFNPVEITKKFNDHCSHYVEDYNLLVEG